MAEMTEMRLDDYRALVEQVMLDCIAEGEDSSSRLFENSGEAHAAIVTNTMLTSARNRVSIYSGQLTKTVWNSDAIRDVVRRVPSASISVLVDDCDNASESAIADLQDLVASGQITVRQLGRESNLKHFCVVDGRHVRFEREASSRKAIVAFGSRELALPATELFDSLWADAGPVDLKGCSLPAAR